MSSETAVSVLHLPPARGARGRDHAPRGRCPVGGDRAGRPDPRGGPRRGRGRGPDRRGAGGRAEAEPALRALAEAGAALQGLRDQLVTELEADAVTLALRLAEQIIAGAIAVAPERLIDVAGQAMRRIADRRHVTLVVNPADLELMEESVLRLQSELGGIEHCNVQADRRVGRGGVIARTEAGEIDATIEAQLSRAQEIVVNELAPR